MDEMHPDVVDELLDYVLAMRRRVDLLRDTLSEALAELPDDERWWDAQELYVVTEPNATEHQETILVRWHERFSANQMVAP
jgi:hypothetical protein